jgi:hypothetical protein
MTQPRQRPEQTQDKAKSVERERDRGDER